MKVRDKKTGPARPARGGRPRNGQPPGRPREPRGLHQGPQTAPMPRPVERPTRAKNASQAKARAKARKAKAPKVVRLPLRERLRTRLVEKLAGVDLRPQAILARIPFVVLVIGALATGLAITLWLSTDSAQRSYQLGNARALNDALAEQKEALERDVLESQSAPALADAARNLGMIPSRDSAHLIQDPGGNWVVVGQPKPAEGVPPPPLNFTLPDEKPLPTAKAAPPVAAKPKPGSGAEVPVRPTPLVPEVPAVVPIQPIPPTGLLAIGPVAPPGPQAPAGLVLEPVNIEPPAPAPVLPPAVAAPVGDPQ